MSPEDAFEEVRALAESRLAELNTDVPLTAWHYTGGGALKAILRGPCPLDAGNDTCEERPLELHATHFRYLNDRTEVAWLRELAEDVLGLGVRPQGGGNQRERLRSWVVDQKGLRGIERPAQYVLSLSAARDDLGQWTRYGDGGRGVALEVTTSLRGGQARRRIGAVDYNNKEVKGLISVVLDKAIEVTATDEEARDLLADVLWLIAPFVKHEKFKSEEEIRVVEYGDPLDGLREGFVRRTLLEPFEFREKRLRFSRVRVKEGGGRLKPYMPISIRKSDIKSIMVGPKAPRGSEEAIGLLLARHEVNAAVDRSIIPLQ